MHLPSALIIASNGSGRGGVLRLGRRVLQVQLEDMKALPPF